MRTFTRSNALLFQRRCISKTPTFIFPDVETAVPVASIGVIMKAVYTKEFKKKYTALRNVEFGENVIYINRTDGWYHWIPEKSYPRLYNELTKFIEDGYNDQFSNNREVKVEMPKTSGAGSFKYEPYKYGKD